MPYIKLEERQRLDWIVDNLIAAIDSQGMTGNLNYVLFRIAKRYCKRYKDYAAFIGEIEACKLEIYRRLAAPYEDKKIDENGDA